MQLNLKQYHWFAGSDEAGTPCNNELGTCEEVPGSNGALSTCVGCGMIGRPCCPNAVANDSCGRPPTTPDLPNIAYCKADASTPGSLMCSECDTTRSNYEPFLDRCCPGALPPVFLFQLIYWLATVHALHKDQKSSERLQQ